VRLQSAIDNEDYAAARTIKAEIDASQRRQTNELAEQLLQRCSKMKQRQDEEKQKKHVREQNTAEIVRRANEIEHQNTNKTTSTEGGGPRTWADSSR
jgi:RNA processing factor Prp31